MTSNGILTLRERLATITDIGGAMTLLGWDQQTKMPRGGAGIRGEQMATLGRIAHELFVSSEMERILTEAEADTDGLDPDSDDLAIVKQTRRAFDKRSAISADLTAESIRARSDGYQIWIDARAANDFASFLPALERITEVNRRTIEALRTVMPDAAEDYDILLDGYEPGLTSVEIASVFDRVRDRTIPLVQQVRDNADAVDDSMLTGTFPAAAQEALSLRVLRQVGFTDDHWRLDETHHPFATSLSTQDVRITTRYLDAFFNSALFGSLHEFGHGLYERQCSPTLDRTGLGNGASMAWHESQSRMWENLVGRGRPFWDWATGPSHEAFPEQLGTSSADALYRAVNRLQPSLIRVEADELTYNLHIILRFEMEREILSGAVELSDLPTRWNEKMTRYLGIEVPSDADGVMQDVHWSGGLFGYFPTYALGNVLSLQLWKRITDEIPGLEDGFREGEFAPLREWLGTNVHSHAAKYLPKDLLEKVLGTRELDPEPLMAYLEGKVADLYGA